MWLLEKARGFGGRKGEGEALETDVEEDLA